MASSLGGLVVTLGLDAAEFTTGLTKTEYEAKRMAARFDRAISQGAQKAATAIAAMGVAAVGAFVAIQKLADEAGNFQDIAEKTGANAEALASFKVSADVAGTSVETIASAMNKLTKGLVSVDDETKDAGAALKALGIPIAEFKQLDPAAQMEEVAKALARFEDGAGKTAVAMALFGKSGAELLPFLKELAAEGGRQVILTQQQIERADAYSDAQKRTRAEVTLWLQMLATEALPTITSAITAMKDFAAAVLGVGTETKKLDGEAVRRFAEDTLVFFAKVINVGDALARVFSFIATGVEATVKVAKAAADFDIAGVRAAINEAAQKDEATLMRPFADDVLRRRFDADRKLRELAAREDRGFKPSGAKLTFTGKADAGGKAAKEQLTDAEKLLETLEREIEKTYELTRAQEVERALAKEGFTGLTEARRQQIIALAEYIDFIKAAKKAEEDQRKVEEDAARSREQQSKAMRQLVDNEYKQAEAVEQGNKQLEEQILFLTQGEEAVRKLNLARLDALITQEKERALQLANAEGTQEQIAGVNAHIRALEKRKELLQDASLAELIALDKAKLQDLKDSFSDALVQPLVDFVNQTVSAKDAFKSFLKSIEQMLTQKAARGIADWIFGGNTQSGFDFGTIFKLFGGMFGGGSSFLNVIDAVPPVFGGFAQGTSFAPGGRAWVGEGGPELVELPRGARVIPNKQSMQMAGRQMVFNVNVLPGADTRSARQAGEQLRDVVMRSIRER